MQASQRSRGNATTPPPPRALRAALAAAVAVGVAALAHRAGHGSVDATGVAWAFAALTGPAWWVARRERGWGALAASQLIGQQAAHLALSTASGPEAHAAALLPTDLMVHLHLAAAGLTAVWLRLGERRAWCAAGRVRRRLTLAVAHLLAGTPAPTAPPLRPRCAPPLARTRTLLLRHALARRGPPLPA